MYETLIGILLLLSSFSNWVKEDDLPKVVLLCCRIIESQLLTDCHGIYRTAANERIKNEVEEEMNKSMENAHTLEQLRDVKICASVLKSFFRQLRVNTYPQKCFSII